MSLRTAPTGCPVSARAAAFNPFEPDYMADPADYLRWARDAEPVFFSPEMGYWVVTRYQDVKEVFRDHGAFSPANALEKITPPTPAVQEVLASYQYAMARTMVNEDEPAHMARRRLLLEPFTPQALKPHEPAVRRLARDYVGRFIDAGRADLVNQMLWEVPLTIALHFLGVDEEDMPLLRQYSIAHTLNTWGRPDEAEQLRVTHAVGNFWQFAGQVLDKMRRTPEGPGWMRFGIRMQATHPDVVTDSYLHSMMMAGIVAAHETTANATANAVRLLLQHPTAWQELAADPALIPNAVEECLRFSGSIVAWRRVALRDVVVGGVPLPAGSKVLMVMESGNHDERHFTEADLLDIRRANAGEHLSFGYGAHQCMGKNLARMELQIFLEELTQRLPHLRLAPQQFSYLPNMSFRGPEHLWVEWDPALNPERVQPRHQRPVQAVRLGDAARGTVARSLRVAGVRPLAAGVLELRLAPEDGRPLPRWTPGAHVDIECGEPERWRSYSLCGSPADATAWQVAVLKEPAGRGGSDWVHSQVRVGDRLRVRGPRNHFRLDDSAPQVLFMAGGIGITPIAAMALQAKARGAAYELHFCGRSRAAMAYLPELQAAHGGRLVLHVSDEGSRMDVAAVLARQPSGTPVLACGPERLLSELAARCPPGTLRVERFHGAAQALNPLHEQAFEVELRDSGLTLQVPADRTLLDVLRAANIDVPSDCGEGLCGSCEVRVLRGAVDHRDVVLTPAERACGDRLMSCCSRAAAGRLVLAL
jgi:cytochrome P450/ferredoxin-NADP reductase